VRRAVLVFALSDPANLPLLRAIARAGDWDLYLVPPTLIEPARAAGVVAHDAFALLDEAAAARIRAQAEGMVRRVEACEPLLARRFSSGTRTFWPRMRGPFLRALAGVAVRTRTMSAILERIAERAGLAAVVLGFDTIAAGRAAAATARRLGVPTVHVPHGVLARPRVPMRWQGAQVFADAVCAPGPYSHAGYVAQGVRPDAVRLTGSPRWDLYAALDAAARARCREAVAAALGLDPAAPLVVYGATWVERGTAHSCAHQQAALAAYRQVLEGVRRLARRRVQLVVKLHPGEWSRPSADGPSLLAGYHGVARRAGVERVVVTAGYKTELIAAADALVVLNSNLGIEGLLCGRPVVNVPLLPVEHDCLFADEPAVVALRRLEEVGAALAAVLDDAALRARLAAAAPAAVRRYAHEPDGRASERVAAVVAELARAA